MLSTKDLKAFVITIQDIKESVDSALRCIDSAKQHNFSSISIFPAVTPINTNPVEAFKSNNISYSRFFAFGLGSRPLNVASCFLSHFMLWKKCIQLDEPILILEHDARFISSAPIDFHDGVLNIGKPSYGKYSVPEKTGIQPLRSKRYLPGAHAYIVSPFAAVALIKEAKTGIPKPTDVFISSVTFPWVQELYPWIVEVDDRFTTVQSIEKGCKSKHAFQKDQKSYKIL